MTLSPSSLFRKRVYIYDYYYYINIGYHKSTETLTFFPRALVMIRQNGGIFDHSKLSPCFSDTYGAIFSEALVNMD